MTLKEKSQKEQNTTNFNLFKKFKTKTQGYNQAEQYTLTITKEKELQNVAKTNSLVFGLTSCLVLLPSTETEIPRTSTSSEMTGQRKLVMGIAEKSLVGLIEIRI